MEANKRLEQRGQRFQLQVHRADQALLPAQVDSFVGCSLHCALHPPACETVGGNVNGGVVGRNPLSRGGHTHTPGFSCLMFWSRTVEVGAGGSARLRSSLVFRRPTGVVVGAQSL